MIFVYLDEFGHNGPFYHRNHPKYKESPVFGLGGIILPEEAVRNFATFFLKRKEELLGFEIKKSSKMAYQWEKKGTNLFTFNSLPKYPEITRTTFRIMNRIRQCGGHIFYNGREKIRGANSLNSNGLYTTIMAHTIQSLDKYAEARQKNFVIIIDQHSARKVLLETAQKTMYGTNPARRLSSPPFEVESYLNQNIQAADWIATIIGRVWQYRLAPEQFSECADYEKYFSSRLDLITTHSSVMRRPPERHIKSEIEPFEMARRSSLDYIVTETTVIKETKTVIIQKEDKKN